jgi:hypothetical protein
VVSQDSGEWEFITAEEPTHGASVTWLTSWLADRVTELASGGLLGTLGGEARQP